MRKPRGAALLAGPEPTNEEEQSESEPGLSGAGSGDANEADGEAEEASEDEAASKTPCSAWLFVGPRHRRFRGLVRQLAQDAGRYAHARFYLCVQDSSALTFGPLAQKLGGLAGVSVVLDERGFYNAAAGNKQLSLQLFDRKNKLALATDDYAAFQAALERRETRRQRATREAFERELRENGGEVRDFYLEESQSRVHSRAGAVSVLAGLGASRGSQAEGGAQGVQDSQNMQNSQNS